MDSVTKKARQTNPQRQSTHPSLPCSDRECDMDMLEWLVNFMKIERPTSLSKRYESVNIWTGDMKLTCRKPKKTKKKGE